MLSAGPASESCNRRADDGDTELLVPMQLIMIGQISDHHTSKSNLAFTQGPVARQVKQ